VSVWCQPILVAYIPKAESKNLKIVYLKKKKEKKEKKH
jgi:hypothetical protein